MEIISTLEDLLDAFGEGTEEFRQIVGCKTNQQLSNVRRAKKAILPAPWRLPVYLAVKSRGLRIDPRLLNLPPNTDL